MTRCLLALVSIAALAAAPVHAQTTAPAPGATTGAANVAAHKQKVLAKIQQRMSTLQTLQSCVNAASDSAAIKSCEEQAHAVNGAHEKKC